MATLDNVSRRGFVAGAAGLSLAAPAFGKKKIPIGLELYSVRDVLMKDLKGTVTAVAKMGYEVVEFYSPYFSWTMDQAMDVRKLLDDLGIKCLSTHNDRRSFAADNVQKAIDLNSTIGSKLIVMASAGRVDGLDGWKKVADDLNFGAGKYKAAGIRAGYHNHQAEWKPIDGTKPMVVLAKNTGKDVVLQLDIGTCLEVGEDPVAWINTNPGRIGCIHCKDYSPEKGKGYHVLFGEGAGKWKNIFKAAEKKGGVEFYLIEQEGYEPMPSTEAAAKCLENYKKLRS
jgi:sugar phosphate isomerase/epimerase